MLTTREAIAIAIKTRMQADERSDAAIADLAGVSLAVIGHWKNGYRSPRPENLTKLEMALKVKPFTLMDDAKKLLRRSSLSASR